MDEAKYWKIVESARKNASELLEIPEYIKAELLKLTRAERDRFEETFWQYYNSLYNDTIRDIAYEIIGGFGSDGFMDFRCWLASLNRNIYDRVVSDPNYLYEIEAMILNAGNMELINA